MRHKYYITLVTIAALCISAATAAASTEPVRIPKTDRPSILQDYLSSDRRDGEFIVSEFRQREPNDGDAATQGTTAYLSYDAHNLYIAFVCVDRNPNQIRARLSKRDAIAQDDQVVVMLDTFHDRQRSYLFAVNPLGIQADAITSEGRDDDYSFDAVWRAEGRLVPNGFVIHMTIPFKSLRISPDPTGTWGIALGRIIPRNSEQSFWPYITRRVEGFAQQFATLESPQRISGGRNIQFIPYSTISTGRYLDARTSRFGTSTDRRAGLDAKVVVHDTVSVDVALNPDFSQVESDQPQVAVNQRFELFYPEKRPFFLENATLFKYSAIPTTRNIPEMLFFSRRIQDPRVGTRVTGKAGHWSFGGILADDRGPSAIVAADTHAGVAVARIQREFANQSTIGALVTSRERAGDVNRVGAIDIRWKFSRNLVFTGLAVASKSELPNGVRRAGPAYNASLLYSSRKFLYSFFYSDRSPSFRTTLGFVPRTDIRQIEQYTEWRRRPRRGPVVAFGPNSYFRLNWNRAGQLQEWIVRFPFQIDLKGRTEIFGRRVESYELFNGVGLREHFQTLNVTTQWLKWLAITEGFEWGVMPNFYPAAGALPHTANSVSASLGLTFRPTPRVRYEQTYLYSGLKNATATIFSNNIIRSTLNYQFTRELSVRAIVDYNSVIPNPSLVQLIKDKRLGFDTLFTYQVGPATAMYVGYTTGFRSVVPAGDGLPVARSVTPRTEVGRQLFVKIGYLIRR